MKIIFSENAWEDYLYWQKSNKKILNRINKLINEIIADWSGTTAEANLVDGVQFQD